jgi:MFS family permease
MSEPEKDSLLHRTVRISNTEGVFSQVYNSAAGPGSIFNTKFAVMLGATPFHFALLVAIVQISQVFQLIGVALTRHLTSRKNVVVRLIGWGRLLTFFVAFLPFILMPMDAMRVFLFLFFASAALQAVGSNAWVAWVSDIIPPSMRARFFSNRTRYIFIAGLIVGFVFSAFIDLFDPNANDLARIALPFLTDLPIFAPGNLPYAFAIIFILGTAAGLVAMRILARQPEKPKLYEQESLLELFLSPLKDKNFRKLLLFAFWWMMAVGIGSPFWQPFMIRNLGMSMVQIQVYGAVSTVAAILTLRFWGKLIDYTGNKTAMVFAIILGGINPFVWVFATPDAYWFLYFEAATSGVMWSGASVIATNFVLAIAPQHKRQVYAAVLGAFSGLAMVVTSLFSGAFLTPPLRVLGLDLASEQVEFGLTSFLRWTSLIPLAWIVETRQKSFGTALHIIFDFTKVRVSNLYGWVRGRLSDVLGNHD